MTFQTLKHIVPIILLIAVAIVVFNARSSPQAPSKILSSELTNKDFDPSRFLIRPSYAPGNQVVLALNGGELSVANGKVPSIVVGENLMRMVHVAWVHDWTRAECLTSFNQLRLLYASEEGASLPALRIYLNPVFSTEAGEALHRALLQVFFRSEDRGCYLAVANELSAGLIKPNAEAIRTHIENINPSLIDDWKSHIEWLENDIQLTFAIARTQRDRNTAILNHESPSQLTGMLAVMPPTADNHEIIAFIKQAYATQSAWLLTLPAPEQEKLPAH